MRHRGGLAATALIALIAPAPAHAATVSIVLSGVRGAATVRMDRAFEVDFASTLSAVQTRGRYVVLGLVDASGRVVEVWAWQPHSSRGSGTISSGQGGLLPAGTYTWLLQAEMPATITLRATGLRRDVRASMRPSNAITGGDGAPARTPIASGAVLDAEIPVTRTPRSATVLAWDYLIDDSAVFEEHHCVSTTEVACVPNLDLHPPHSPKPEGVTGFEIDMCNGCPTQAGTQHAYFRALVQGTLKSAWVLAISVG